MINKFRWWLVKKISPWIWKLTPATQNKSQKVDELRQETLDTTRNFGNDLTKSSR